MGGGIAVKILSFNANYFLGFDGTLRNYVRHPTRGIRANQEAERAAIEQFVSLVSEESPDIISLLEVDHGSFRTHTAGQTSLIAQYCREYGIDYTFCTDNKYGPHTSLSHLPIFCGMSNSLLWQGDCTVSHHYLAPGTKQLVHELELADGLSVFSVHLPLFRRTRRKQLEQLQELVNDRSYAIVCGDFNTLHGQQELRPLRETGLNLYSPGDTFTTPRGTTRALDHVLCSPELSVERLETISTHVSDHQPVICDVTL